MIPVQTQGVGVFEALFLYWQSSVSTEICTAAEEALWAAKGHGELLYLGNCVIARLFLLENYACI